MDLYEVLGVARDASASDVRAAFRREASKAHPDRGGDTDRMQAVNKAYEVLGDPERRQQYDETGAHEQPPPLRHEANQAIAAALQAVIEAGADALLDAVRQGIDANMQDVRKNLQNLKVRRKRLEKLSGRFKTKSEVNIVQGVIDQQLAMIPDTERRLKHAEKILDEANAVLSEYTDDAALMQPAFVSYFSTGTGTYWSGA